MTLAALLLAALTWDASPDPTVTSYRVAYQGHYRTDVPCPTPEDPAQMCATYWAGAWTTEVVPDLLCGARCASGLTMPYILTGEVVWFQLVAARDSGCESATAWPPA